MVQLLEKYFKKYWAVGGQQWTESLHVNSVHQFVFVVIPGKTKQKKIQQIQSPDFVPILGDIVQLDNMYTHTPISPAPCHLFMF